MYQEKRNDVEVQQAIKSLFLGIAPERASELSSLWDTYQLEFCLFSDGNQVMIEGGAYRYVHFNHRFLRVVWVSAFAAWEAYACLQVALAEEKTKNSDRLTELLQIALSVRDASDPEAVPLVGLPEPGHLPDKEAEPQLRAAAELAIFATGWALLHEVQHLKHQQDGSSAGPDAPPDLARAEELSCDEFATQFLMRDVARYAIESDSDAEIAHRKRTTGIYFAMFALVVLNHPKWHETDSHPSVQQRLDAVREHLSGNRIDEGLCIAALAFSSLQDLWPSAPNLVR